SSTSHSLGPKSFRDTEPSWGSGTAHTPLSSQSRTGARSHRGPSGDKPNVTMAPDGWMTRTSHASDPGTETVVTSQSGSGGPHAAARTPPWRRRPRSADVLANRQQRPDTGEDGGVDDEDEGATPPVELVRGFAPHADVDPVDDGLSRTGGEEARDV